MSNIKEMPIWKEKYSKLGVNPCELYMRQNKLCWLLPEKNLDGTFTIYCTDGKDKARTDRMLNPTIECVQCMVGFTTQTIEHEIRKKE